MIFTGIPGCGKSTFFKERFFDTHVRINLDMLGSRRREAVLLRAVLEAGQRFVVDNTNTTAEGRAYYIGLAKEAGFSVSGYYFSCTLRECLERNSLRTGKARVPDKAIAGFHRRMQVPRYEEGYDRLYDVRIAEQAGFVVTERHHERVEGA